MNGNRRPISVTILACLYLAAGAIGFAFHFKELLAAHPDAVGIELTEFVAILCGAFLLRGHNWARWLALAWIVFHVVLSAFHSVHEVAIHGLLCAVIAWLLFRTEATRYFCRARTEAT